MEYKSAIQRLSDLPEVFSRNTLMRTTGWTKSEAAIYLMRWSKKEWVKASGPRTNIFYNQFKNPAAREEHFAKALKETYALPVLRGASVLRSAGWSTQIPNKVQLAVVNQKTTARVDGAEVVLRSGRWFQEVKDHLLKPSDTEWATYGFLSLTPAMALADMWVQKESEDNWHPDPDDLDFEAKDWEEVRKCFKILNTPVPSVYEDWFGKVFEEEQGRTVADLSGGGVGLKKWN
jgi:hypothetical protein